MTIRSLLTALLALGGGGGAAGSAGGLHAQVAGLPVRNAGIGTGVGIAADLGFPNGAAGKGFAIGATGAAGLGPFGVTGSVAHWDPAGESPVVNSVGVTGNLKIFGGPLIPVSVTVQAGLGYYKQTSIEGSTVSTWHLPVGVGLGLTIPNPVFSIKPWVAPRLDVLRTKEPGGSSTDTKFGISAGIDLGFLSGLSVRAMYDRVRRGGVNFSVVSLGLGFRVGT